jgi:hypothetical protein
MERLVLCPPRQVGLDVSLVTEGIAIYGSGGRSPLNDERLISIFPPISGVFHDYNDESHNNTDE